MYYFQNLKCYYDEMQKERSNDGRAILDNDQNAAEADIYLAFNHAYNRMNKYYDAVQALDYGTPLIKAAVNSAVVKQCSEEQLDIKTTWYGWENAKLVMNNGFSRLATVSGLVLSNVDIAKRCAEKLAEKQDDVEALVKLNNELSSLANNVGDAMGAVGTAADGTHTLADNISELNVNYDNINDIYLNELNIRITKQNQLNQYITNIKAAVEEYNRKIALQAAIIGASVVVASIVISICGVTFASLSILVCMVASHVVTKATIELVKLIMELNQMKKKLEDMLGEKADIREEQSIISNGYVLFKTSMVGGEYISRLMDTILMPWSALYEDLDKLREVIVSGDNISYETLLEELDTVSEMWAAISKNCLKLTALEVYKKLEDKFPLEDLDSEEKINELVSKCAALCAA